jgi:hypothetical protein
MAQYSVPASSSLLGARTDGPCTVDSLTAFGNCGSFDVLVASAASDWASVIVTALVGVVGVLVATSIRRDFHLKVAGRRLASYERLWALMRIASPYDPLLDAHARRRLHGQLTDWYYAFGDGMLLGQTTREVYLKAKDNLIDPLERIVPKQASERLKALKPAQLDIKRGQLSQRQLSLLRTQMKTDLAVYGRPYREDLDAEDRAFLRKCGVHLWRRPWRRASFRRPRSPGG